MKFVCCIGIELELPFPTHCWQNFPCDHVSVDMLQPNHQILTIWSHSISEYVHDMIWYFVLKLFLQNEGKGWKLAVYVSWFMLHNFLWSHSNKTVRKILEGSTHLNSKEWHSIVLIAQNLYSIVGLEVELNP